ncbi:MAG: AAA family ATPase [Phycisphaerales bacterium]
MTTAPTRIDDQASRLRALVDRLDRQRTDQGHQPRLRSAPVIAIASGKGGVGKTTTSVNLSIALAKRQRRVTLLDADIGMANADVLCGMMPKMRLEKAVGEGNIRALNEIALDAPGGFKLVPGSVGLGRMDELNDNEQEQLVARLIEIERASDMVLIDTSAGMGDSVRRFMRAADLGLVVVTPEPTSIADAYALIKVLVSLKPAGGAPGKAPTLGLIINQVVNEKEAHAVHARIGGVCDRFLEYRLPLIGWVRRDKRVANAVRRRTPVMIESPRSAAAKDLDRLAGSLVDWAGR